MDPQLVHILTIGAAFSQSIVLGVTLFIFYKNLSILRKQNEVTFKRFEFQSNVEKYTLTLRFADWVASETRTYLPCINADEENSFLTKDEIKVHFENISKNMIKLVDDNIIFKDLVKDEIKKLMIALGNWDDEKELIEKLKDL